MLTILRAFLARHICRLAEPIGRAQEVDVASIPRDLSVSEAVVLVRYGPELRAFAADVEANADAELARLTEGER